MTALSDIISRVKPGDKVLYVSFDEYAEIASSAMSRSEIRPGPPVKVIRETVESSLFGGSYSKHVEYDFHAPEYLRSLEDWHRRQELDLGPKILCLYTPYGQIEVRVQGDECPTS